MGGVALSPDVRPLGFSEICSSYIYFPIGAFHFSLIKIQEIRLVSVIGLLTTFEFLTNIHIVSRAFDFCSRNILVVVPGVIDELSCNPLPSSFVLCCFSLAPLGLCSKKYSL